MRFLRRHPRPIEIGAWFDGEGDGGIGAHVVACARCRAYASDLARLRTVVRPAARTRLASGDAVGRRTTP